MFLSADSFLRKMNCMVLALFSELWCLTPQSFGGDQVAVLVLEMMQVQAPWEDNAQELWLLLAI